MVSDRFQTVSPRTVSLPIMPGKFGATPRERRCGSRPRAGASDSNSSPRHVVSDLGKTTLLECSRQLQPTNIRIALSSRRSFDQSDPNAFLGDQGFFGAVERCVGSGEALSPAAKRPGQLHPLRDDGGKFLRQRADVTDRNLEAEDRLGAAAAFFQFDDDRPDAVRAPLQRRQRFRSNGIGFWRALVEGL
ncbi:hypothetical protein SAMN04488239_108145 [Ruegeria marina]|uniref:Uncharacterized protein n=1 Tax=Ruegeria marina TaxID=639004 RepID=A0A1G6VSD1_9RHOB|nr:hypothetical protein SAMN04488239_108145 [Ruegeria marina]